MSVCVCVCYVLLCQIIKCFFSDYHQMTPSSSTSKDPPAVPSEQNISASAEFQGNGSEFLELFEEENIQHQESCREDNFNPLQPLKLDCSLNWEMRQ